MKAICTLIILVTTFLANRQTSKLIVNQNINLPKDTTIAKYLLTSLDSFLVAAQKPNEQNNDILPSQKIETFMLLEEVNGIEKVENTTTIFL